MSVRHVLRSTHCGSGGYRFFTQILGTGPEPTLLHQHPSRSPRGCQVCRTPRGAVGRRMADPAHFAQSFGRQRTGRGDARGLAARDEWRLCAPIRTFVDAICHQSRHRRHACARFPQRKRDPPGLSQDRRAIARVGPQARRHRAQPIREQSRDEQGRNRNQHRRARTGASLRPIGLARGRFE